MTQNGADPRELLLGHFGLVQDAIDWIACRHHLTPAEAEGFGGAVRKRIAADDFRVLRDFKGRSSVSNYLILVVQHSSAMHLAEARTNWRNPATPGRSGTLARELEQLTHPRSNLEELWAALRGTSAARRRDIDELWESMPLHHARLERPDFGAVDAVATADVDVPLGAASGGAPDDRATERGPGSEPEAGGRKPWLAVIAERARRRFAHLWGWMRRRRRLARAGGETAP